VGFKYRKADDWLDLNTKQEGVRLVGFNYQKGYDWLDLNSKQDGVRLVGFKYQKGYDWLDSQFQCSYLESRRVPEKPREIISLSFPVTSFPVMQLPVMQLPVTSLLHTAPPQMGFEMSPYTTYIFRIFQYSHLNYTTPAVTVTLMPGFNH
jgi:hypothetical protein